MSLCVAFFTATVLIIRFAGAQQAIGSWSLVFVRGLIGLLFVMAWYSRSSGLRLDRLFVRPALIARGLLGTTGLLCYYWTIPHLGAGIATLICNTYVVFGAVFASFYLVREKLSPTQLIWLLISLLGVALLTENGTPQSAPSFAFGIALLGAIAAGMVIVVIRYLHRSEATPTIFAAQCVYAMIAILPWAFPELIRLSFAQLGWAALAGLTAAIGQLTMTHAYRYLSVSAGGTFHLTIPVWVCIGGFLLFGERFTTLQLAGAVCVLLGCLQALKR